MTEVDIFPFILGHFPNCFPLQANSGDSFHKGPTCFYICRHLTSRPRENFKNTGSNKVRILLLAYTEADAKFMASSPNSNYAGDLFGFLKVGSFPYCKYFSDSSWWQQSILRWTCVCSRRKLIPWLLATEPELPNTISGETRPWNAPKKTSTPTYTRKGKFDPYLHTFFWA